MKPAMKTLKLSMLAPWAANPRTITPEARAALRASLKRFGCVDPIIVNRKGAGYEVIGGHQRLALLIEGGAAEAPCVVVDLPDPEARALALTLNNPRAQGEWSDGLAEVIRDLERQTTVSDLVLDLLAREVSAPLPEPEEVKVPRPVKRVWVLLGIPADRYQEHAGAIDGLHAEKGIEVHVKAE